MVPPEFIQKVIFSCNKAMKITNTMKRCWNNTANSVSQCSMLNPIHTTGQLASSELDNPELLKRLKHRSFLDYLTFPCLFLRNHVSFFCQLDLADGAFYYIACECLLLCVLCLCCITGSVRGGCELRDNLCQTFTDMFKSIIWAKPHCSTKIWVTEILTEVKSLFRNILSWEVSSHRPSDFYWMTKKIQRS